MYFYSRAVMGQQLSCSSNACSEDMAAEPGESMTGKLRSHGVAQREFIPETLPNPSQYANTRAELSHQPTRGREGVTRQSVARAPGLKVTWAAVFCGVTVTVAGGRWTVPAGRLGCGR